MELIQHLYLAPHGSPADLRELPDHMTQAALFIPEMANWQPAVSRVFNKVAQGYKQPEEGCREIGADPKRGDGLIINWELQALYRKNIPVLFFDIPFRHTLLGEIRMNEATFPEITTPNQLSWAEKMRQLASYMTRANQLRDKRDDFMVSQATQRLPRLQTEFPRMRGQSSGEALWNIGSNHTGLGLKLEQAGFLVKTSLAEAAKGRSLINEGYKKIRTTPLTGDELAKIALQTVVGTLFHKHYTKAGLPDSEFNIDAYTLISQVNPADIPDLVTVPRSKLDYAADEYLEMKLLALAKDLGLRIKP